MSLLTEVWHDRLIVTFFFFFFTLKVPFVRKVDLWVSCTTRHMKSFRVSQLIKNRRFGIAGRHPKASELIKRLKNHLFLRLAPLKITVLIQAIHIFKTYHCYDVMRFVCGSHPHYAWQIVTHVGFVLTTAVLHSVGGTKLHKKPIST